MPLATSGPNRPQVMKDKANNWRYANLAVLILAALFMRALVPQGYMPDASSDHIFAIKPCPIQAGELSHDDHSSHDMAMDMDMSDHSAHADHSMHGAQAAMADQSHSAEDHSDHQAPAPCSFAGFALAAMAGDDLIALPRIYPAVQHYDRDRSDIIILARRRTLPPARGPPVSV